MRSEVTCLLLLLYSVLAGRILPEGIFLYICIEGTSDKGLELTYSEK